MKSVLVAFLILLISSSLQAFEVGDVEVPGQLLGDKELVLNGAGVREKLFLDLYVGGLYLAKPSSHVEEILGVDQKMAIRLEIVSKLITSEKMTKATDEGFSNSTAGNAEKYKFQIAAFIEAFQAEIKKGDVFEIIYNPGEGIHICKNNVFLKCIECSVPFKDAVFGIWLCDKPAQKSLKKAMLGD